MYGLVECPEPGYPPRTRANVEGSDGTIWFGSITSRGFRTTHDAALQRSVGYPVLIVYEGSTKPSEVVAWLRKHEVRVLNAAGNRESGNPGIGERVERFLIRVFRQIRD
jgi:Circularly permutated YpsA SLOG family